MCLNFLQKWNFAELMNSQIFSLPEFALATSTAIPISGSEGGLEVLFIISEKKLCEVRRALTQTLHPGIRQLIVWPEISSDQEARLCVRAR